MTALGIEGLRIGTWSSPTVPTGCTVLLPPAASLGAVAVSGPAPGTREAAALGPHGKVEVCHGVVLSGGSAYGLAAADGVVRWLEQQGIGYSVRIGVVPIVGAAILLDASVAFPDDRPDAAAGWAACEAAAAADPPEGAVGAGAGATVAGVGGLEHAWRGGQGAAIRRHRDLVVGALVVNNAVGEVRTPDGRWVARSRAPADAPRYPWADGMFEADTQAPAPRSADDELAARSTAEPADGSVGPAANTVIGCVVTNARLDKRSAHRVAEVATGGIAQTVVPAATWYDGDALFCLATNAVAASADQVAALAVEAVAEACWRGPAAAVSRPAVGPLPPLPGVADAP